MFCRWLKPEAKNGKQNAKIHAIFISSFFSIWKSLPEWRKEANNWLLFKEDFEKGAAGDWMEVLA